MKVSIEAVEWFKRTIIQTGDLNITDEEIEMWMREQQDEYKQTLKENERQGRVRRKKKQVSAYTEGIEEQINPDFIDNEVKDYLGKFTPETRPPTPEEQRIERKKKGGYSPEQGSYYDEVFED
jgi:exonuclease III